MFPQILVYQLKLKLEYAYHHIRNRVGSPWHRINSALGINNSELFWYRLISRKAFAIFQLANVLIFVLINVLPGFLLYFLFGSWTTAFPPVCCDFLAHFPPGLFQTTAFLGVFLGVFVGAFVTRRVPSFCLVRAIVDGRVDGRVEGEGLARIGNEYRSQPLCLD